MATKKKPHVRKLRTKTRSLKFKKSVVRLTIEEHDLYGATVDMASKRPDDSFEQIIARVVPEAMLRARGAKPLIVQLKKAYELAR